MLRVYSFTVVTNPRIFHRTHDASAKTLNTLIFNGSIVYSPIGLDLLHSKVSCLQAVTVTTLVAFSLFSFLFLFFFFSVLIILTKFTLEELRSDRTETTLDPYKTPQGKLLDKWLTETERISEMLWRPHIKQHQGACIVRE